MTPMERREVWMGPTQAEVARRQEAPTPAIADARLRLPRGLLLELFQAEASARRHGTREARKLGDTPPGRALQVIARHAAATLRALPGLTGPHGVDRGRLGRMIGTSFSMIRRVVDPLLGAERAYRLTLLGLHHGVDTVRMIRGHAIDAGDDQLVGWCDAWLENRLRQLQNAEIALLWFGGAPGGTTHPA